MMVIIFKALFLYFLFLFVRSVWRGYRMVQEIKSRASEYSGAEYQTQRPPKAQSNGPKNDVLEAEYRILNDD